MQTIKRVLIILLMPVICCGLWYIFGYFNDFQGLRIYDYKGADAWKLAGIFWGLIASALYLYFHRYGLIFFAIASILYQTGSNWFLIFVLGAVCFYIIAIPVMRIDRDVQRAKRDAYLSGKYDENQRE